MQVANLTQIEVGLDFINPLLVKVGCHLATGEANSCIVLRGSPVSRGIYRLRAAMLQCKPGHLSDIFATLAKLLMSDVLWKRKWGSQKGMVGS